MAGAESTSPAGDAEDRERLKRSRLRGRPGTVTVGTQWRDSLPDPKDKVHVLEQYRGALELVRQQPDRGGRRDIRRIVAENPAWPTPGVKSAGLLVRLGRRRGHRRLQDGWSRWLLTTRRRS